MLKSKNRVRFMTLLLAALMLLSSLTVLAGCADSGEGDGTGTATSASDVKETATEAETKDVPYSDFEKTKYNKEFVILNREDLDSDFEIDNEDGENSLLDELLVERNTVVSEDFGIDFVYLYKSSYGEVNSAVSQQSLNSLDDYDVAIGHKFSVTSCLVNNYLYDLASINTMDLTGSWWDQGCRANMVIDGKVYMMTGDIIPSSMLISSCFAFNKRIMKELGKTEPYALVREGNWTLDEYNALTQDVTQDLDGDGVLDYNKDRYSLSAWKMDAPFSLFYGAGGMFNSIGEDGNPELSFEDADIINRYEKIYKAIIDRQAYYVTDAANYSTSYEMFAAGHALFYDTTLGKIKNFLTDMTDDYGIVPVPKYDANQKEYQSFVNGASGFIMIVNTEKDTEYVGTILEAMARYNYENVSTKMFEIVTKLQNVRDQDSSEMVDYIIRNRVYDFAYFLDLDVSNVVLTQLNDGKAEISAKLKSSKNSSKNVLKRQLKQLQKKQSKT